MSTRDERPTIPVPPMTELQLAYEERERRQRRETERRSMLRVTMPADEE